MEDAENLISAIEHELSRSGGVIRLSSDATKTQTRLWNNG